ncbi:MAG: adenine phosphoribosyltransferase [Microthrixaceae bacterium]
MSQRLYNVELDGSGIVLSLPIVNVKGTDIALFNPRGKTELNRRCAQLLAARFPKEATVILMAAGKAEGLLQATSEVANIPAAVAVKEIKPYMTNLVSLDVGTVTSDPQQLHMDEESLAMMRGAFVIILDDVVSSGATESVLKRFIELAGGTHIGTAAVFTEGTRRAEVISLGHLPLPAVPNESAR